MLIIIIHIYRACYSQCYGDISWTGKKRREENPNMICLMHHGNNGQHSIDNKLYLNVIQHVCIIILFDIIEL